MKKKLLMTFHVLVILVLIGILVYTIYITGEVNYDVVTKYVITIVGYILAVTGVKKRTPRSLKVYEEQYKDIIGGAFSEDRSNYKKLLSATVYYNKEQYGKAHQTLDKLLKSCTRTRDYAAVYMFKALCYDDERLFEKAIETYQKVLQYEMGNSVAWSNLGLLYMELGMAKEAEEAYSSAILYDSKNPFAYNNLGVYYVRNGEPEPALDNAMQALKLNSRMYQAMGTAAIAYKMLGDEENAEKYCKMYGVNGGDAKNLKNKLASI